MSVPQTEKYEIHWFDQVSRQAKRARAKVNRVLAPVGHNQIKQHHNRQALVGDGKLVRGGGRLWHRKVLIGVKIIALVIHVNLAACKDLAGLPEVQGLLCGRQLWKLLRRLQLHKGRDVVPGSTQNGG